MKKGKIMRNYVFGILAYNQEQYIVETLESIKFQKIQYGADLEVSLIITDDASKDQTVAVANAWIAKNREYFSNVHVIANEKNQGIPGLVYPSFGSARRFWRGYLSRLRR